MSFHCFWTQVNCRSFQPKLLNVGRDVFDRVELWEVHVCRARQQIGIQLPCKGSEVCSHVADVSSALKDGWDEFTWSWGLTVMQAVVSSACVREYGKKWSLRSSTHYVKLQQYCPPQAQKPCRPDKKPQIFTSRLKINWACRSIKW